MSRAASDARLLSSVPSRLVIVKHGVWIVQVGRVTTETGPQSLLSSPTTTVPIAKGGEITVTDAILDNSEVHRVYRRAVSVS
jgi:hypothetical protein